MKTCKWCGEKILASEANVFFPNFHRECAIRQTCGSVAHLEKRCGCFVEDSEEGDPPGVSKREAAFAAMQLLQAQERAKEEADEQRRQEPTQSAGLRSRRVGGAGGGGIDL